MDVYAYVDQPPPPRVLRPAALHPLRTRSSVLWLTVWSVGLLSYCWCYSVSVRGTSNWELLAALGLGVVPTLLLATRRSVELYRFQDLAAARNRYKLCTWTQFVDTFPAVAFSDRVYCTTAPEGYHVAVLLVSQREVSTLYHLVHSGCCSNWTRLQGLVARLGLGSCPLLNQYVAARYNPTAPAEDYLGLYAWRAQPLNAPNPSNGSALAVFFAPDLEPYGWYRFVVD